MSLGCCVVIRRVEDFKVALGGTLKISALSLCFETASGRRSDRRRQLQWPKAARVDAGGGTAVKGRGFPALLDRYLALNQAIGYGLASSSY